MHFIKITIRQKSNIVRNISIVQWSQIWFSDVGGLYKDNVKQDFNEKIHNSRTSLWKLWSKVDREIPKNTLIHKSIFNRRNINKSYISSILKENNSYEVAINEGHLD